MDRADVELELDMVAGPGPAVATDARRDLVIDAIDGERQQRLGAQRLDREDRARTPAVNISGGVRS